MCHPELVSGSHMFEMLKQVLHDRILLMKKHSFVILSLIIPLLFTSCLADALNDKFGFKTPETDTREEFSEAHIYEYYFLDFESSVTGFVSRDSKKADIVSLSNTTFKPVEEYQNCIIIEWYRDEESFANYSYNGKIYEKVLITRLFYYNPNISIDNFANLLNTLPDAPDNTYTWYIKVIDSSVESMTYSNPVSSYNGTKMINLDLTGCTALTGFGSDAFADKLWLREISFNVKTLATDTFNGCTNLEKVDFGSNLKTIEVSAFSLCTKLQSITIPQSVTFINQEAFSDCWALESVVLPSRITTIASGTFKDCGMLASIFIPSGYTTIESEAFFGCSSLREIYFPESITTIGTDAFSQVPGAACTIICQGGSDQQTNLKNLYPEFSQNFSWDLGRTDLWQ